MIEGFDKEIDAILRKARGGESVILNNSHLDADEISAFAENALPEKSKPLYTKHLADCDRCRRILSNIISLNSEAEIVPAFVAAKEIQTAPSAPWYRRLFAFPNLAYSLGALVLVFGGLIGFTVLQSLKSGEISQINDKPFEPKSVPAANTASNTMATSNATTATNSTTANTSVNSNSAAVSPSNSATSSTANTAVANSSIKQNSPAKEKLEDKTKKADEYYCQDCGSGDEEATPQPTVETENKDAVTTRSLPNPVKKVERDEDTKTDKNSDSAVRQEQKPKLSSPNSGTTTTETQTVSGKTFNRRNNIWIDSQYKGQSTTNITRGTDDYKKLDSDLRQTVERLGGTVVIVWKAKAYKIQ